MGIGIATRRICSLDKNIIVTQPHTYFISIEGRSEITPEAVSARTGMEIGDLKRFPHAAVGSVDEVCEELQRRREEYGFSYITVGDAHLDAYLPIVERLAGT